MNSNPLLGRLGRIPEHLQSESAVPDPGLTITVVIFCVMGPFWLILKLIEQVTKKADLVSDRTMQA